MTEYANFDDDHVQAPAEHSPRKGTHKIDDDQIMVVEIEAEDAWIQGNWVSVER